MANNDIIVKLRLAGEQFDRDFKVKFQDLTNAAEQASVESGAKAGGGFVKGFLGAAGVAAIGTAIGAAISSAADLGKEIQSTSKQFNIGAENLQVWRQAATNAGVSTDQFSDTLGTLTEKIGQAVAGNRAAQQAFVDLGVGFETTSGQARATDAVMLDLAKRIAEIEDPAERARVGTQLLGDEFKNIYPLLVNGADGFTAASAEIDKFGGALSAEELQNLDKLNKDLEEMKNQLSRSVAKVVADNADSISALAASLTDLASSAVQAAGDYLAFYRQLDRYSKIDMSKLGKPGYQQNYPDPDVNAQIRALLAPDVRAPRVTPVVRRTGGGGGGARTPTQTAAEKEAERAAKEAIRNEEQLRDAIARTLKAQQDSAEVARIRSEQGEEAAARAEAELGFLRQNPLAVNDTIEALAKALGITKALTEADRQRLQLLIDQGNAAQAATGDAAAAKVRAEQEREAKKQEEQAAEVAKRAAERWQQEYERAIYDVANIYESAFRGGTKDLWRNFKDEGTRIIAEIAAQWTLSLIAGQKFDLGSAAGAAFGRSPLSSLFFGLGGNGRAANDNGMYSLGGLIDFNPVMSGSGLRGGGGLLPTGGILPTTGGGFNATLGKAGFLQSKGFALGLGALTTQLVGGKSTGSQIGGLLGSVGGQALGSRIAALGSFGGPVGAIAGALLGSFLPKLFAKTPSGNLGITGIGGRTQVRSNKSEIGQGLGTMAGSLEQSLQQIAQALGADIGAFSVSIGQRKGYYRVGGDANFDAGSKNTRGALYDGTDANEAMRVALRDAIMDGAIKGISQASQNLLAKGGELEKQIEKAMLIEQIPKLLKQRTDPLGAALDELYDKFKKVNDALVEGSASAEQFAQARQLWELEKADAIKSVGAASKTLTDFLAGLNAGSNSPLSLREQRAEAERQLAPYLGQISAAENARAEVERLKANGGTAAEIAAAEAKARTAASAIDQSGFTQASQLLLSISRQANASSGGFFTDFDRIRALTGQAIGFVDQATARGTDTRDPFSQAIAKNTQDAAYILSDQTAILRDILNAINDNGIGGGSGSGFISDGRAFVNVARQ